MYIFDHSGTLNSFSTREDSTVKKIKKCLQEGAFRKKKCHFSLFVANGLNLKITKGTLCNCSTSEYIFV